MYKLKYFFAAFVMFITFADLYAQSSTNSPYTRFGYGEINTTSFSGSRSMGGIGVGYRAKQTINPVNPASYSNVDTLTFMFDLGGSAKLTSFKSGDEKMNTWNGNFDYVTMLFPVTKWGGISLGLNPFSVVGYNFSSTETIKANTDENPLSEDVTVKRSYEGSGGLSQVYLGASGKILNRLALGINAYYLFGSIDHSRALAPTSVSGYTSTQKSNLHVKDFRMRYGIQYFETINKKHDITIGAVFENKTSLNGDYEFITIAGGTGDTLKTKSGFDMPNMFGVGFYYTYDKKLSIGFDYTFQQWEDAKYYGETKELRNASKYALGVEYLPEPFSNKYYKRIRYRAGATLSNSYIKMDDDLNNYSITLGFGLPLRRNASILNVGFEYGSVGESSASMIRENFFKISISATFIETWFFKSKIR